jgi:hypothetical protein
MNNLVTNNLVTSNPATVVAPPATATSTIGGIASSLPNDVLEQKAKKKLASRSENCPDTLIDLVIQVAQQNGGSVAGMPYDVQAAKDALTQVGDLQTQLNVARQLVQRLEDEVVQTRISVADPTFAIYTALRRLTKTAKYNSLLPAYQQMQEAVKNRPRRTRGPKKPKQPGIRALRKAAKEQAAAEAAAAGAKASAGGGTSTGSTSQQETPPVAGGVNPKA